MLTIFPPQSIYIALPRTHHRFRRRPLPPDLRRRRHRLRPHRLSPLHRRRSLRRRALPAQSAPAAQRPALRRRARPAGVHRAGRQLHPARHQAAQACPRGLEHSGHVWPRGVWIGVSEQESESGVKDDHHDDHDDDNDIKL